MIRNEGLFGPGTGDISKALGFFCEGHSARFKTSYTSVLLYTIDLYNVLEAVLPLKTQLDTGGTWLIYFHN